MQPVSQPSRRSSARSAATPIHHHKRSRRGRERWRRMDHLQHWRNGSLRSVHSSSPSLSLSRSPTTKPCHYPSHNRTERTSEQASKGRRGNQRTREGGRRAAIGLIRHNVVVPRYSARPPDRWNTLRRGGRGYRQLESWHQTTMGGGEAGREEKKPDGRATAAKCLLVQSASRPPSTRFSTVVIRHLRRHRRRRRRSRPVLALDAFMHND